MNLDPFDKLVFMHFPKTAGTTLHDELVKLFADEQICPERYSNIRRFNDDEIESFTYFSGHYTMNDIDAIPNPKKIITFLRKPEDRILSLYYFWRGHTDETIKKHNLGGPLLAKSMPLLDFLKHEGNGIPNNIDNVYTRNLIGMPRSLKGKPYYGPGGAKAAIEVAKKRLDSMFFVGFKERFEKDTATLCEKLKLDIDPAAFNVKKRTFDNFENTPGMEKVEKEEITPEIKKELARLTKYDKVLYRHSWSQTK